MTPEEINEIRAEYVETLARHEYQDLHKGELKAGMFSAWEKAPEAMRGVYLRNAGRAVDALAEAGLLPTAVEYGPQWTGLDAQQRYVTGWRAREVSE